MSIQFNQEKGEMGAAFLIFYIIFTMVAGAWLSYKFTIWFYVSLYKITVFVFDNLTRIL
jgi:hypothetical protein